MSGFSAYKRQRRTATSVLAGNFDMRYGRDALTSVLNGVPHYKPAEKNEEVRRSRKKEKQEQEKEKKRAKEAAKAREKAQAPVASTSASASTRAPSAAAAVKRPVPVPVSAPAPRAAITPSPFWQTRPTIQIATMQRSVSVTPPPMMSSPSTTPVPSVTSSTSFASSKRPRTPEDDEDLNDEGPSIASGSPQPTMQPPRKKRQASKKGWKGWVEGSPPPSEKLINLDVVTVLHERKTRSGKNFDAIGVGKNDWV